MDKIAQRRGLLSRLREKVDEDGHAAEINKTAQRRGILHHLREKTDFPGKLTETFSPAFKAIMENLVSKDNFVRDLLTEDVNLKDLLKDARSDFNKREYMQAVVKLKKFHDTLDKVYKALYGFKMDVSKAHEEFIFEGLDESVKKDLTGLKSKFDTKAHQNNYLTKDAGISDWWNSFDRSRALKAWEKRYPGQMKKLKSQTDSLISKSEQLWKLLLSSLKDMSWARANRKVEDYLKSLEKFTKKYEEYNEQFKQYYVENIKNFVEKLQLDTSKQVETKDNEGQQKIEVQPKTEVQSPVGIGQQKIEVKKPTEVSPEQATREALDKMNPNVPDLEDAAKRRDQAEMKSVVPPQNPSVVKVPSLNLPEHLDIKDENKDKDKYPKIHELEKPKAAHKKFINTLEIFSNEHPMILAKEIYKYAKLIENTDKKSSLKLLSIVNHIIK